MAKKSKTQLDTEIEHALAAPKAPQAPHAARGAAPKKKATPRIAYRLQLTPSEVRAVKFARGRYQWPDMLSQHVLENGLVTFTEPQMWQWTDDVDSDTEGDHSPFPLAAPEFVDKLQRFYDERV